MDHKVKNVSVSFHKKRWWLFTCAVLLLFFCYVLVVAWSRQQPATFACLHHSTISINDTNDEQEESGVVIVTDTTAIFQHLHTSFTNTPNEVIVVWHTLHSLDSFIQWKNESYVTDHWFYAYTCMYNFCDFHYTNGDYRASGWTEVHSFSQVPLKLNLCGDHITIFSLPSSGGFTSLLC